MALLFNANLNANLPLRLIGGSPGNLRSMWGRTERSNLTVGQGISNQRALAGVPYGHRHPSAWIMPRSAGALSGFTAVRGQLTVGTLNVAAGRNLVGSTSVTWSVGPSLLELVVSATGSATVTFTTTGNAAAALSAPGSSSVTFTAGPSTLGAIIDALASASVTFSTSATPRAVGYLAGDVLPYATLSPENMAIAVWERILEAGYSAQECMRILTAVAAGKTDITDLGGGSATVVFRNLADTKDRVDADMTGSERTSVTLDVS